MSQLDDARQHQLAAEGAITAGRHVDWAVLVVLLALGCTLAWICLWLWVIVRGLQLVFS
jgi:hypothetical protein